MKMIKVDLSVTAIYLRAFSIYIRKIFKLITDKSGRGKLMSAVYKKLKQEVSDVHFN